MGAKTYMQAINPELIEAKNKIDLVLNHIAKTPPGMVDFILMDSAVSEARRALREASREIDEWDESVNG